MLLIRLNKTKDKSKKTKVKEINRTYYFDLRTSDFSLQWMSNKQINI
jgi:hypothetical protein